MINVSSIKVTKTDKSRLSQVDFENIPFGHVFSDHMFLMEYSDGQWQEGHILPVDKLHVHPANMAWHYGQSIFEGMKAFKNNKGQAVIYRLSDHVARLNRSAERMCMPTVDNDLLAEAISTLVDVERDWIPSGPNSSLYLRPFMFAADEFLGVAPGKTYKLIIMACPVGPYYAKPVKLYADDTYVRAVNGGVGEAKTAGNYAASLLPSKLAKDKGFDQVLWLDAVEHKYIQEVGTMNIFFVFEDEIVTPSLDGAILNGITRDSFITILKDEIQKIEQRPLSIDEVFDRHSRGELKEVFGAGTAAVVSVVEKLVYQDKEINLDSTSYKIAPFLKSRIGAIRSGEYMDKYEWLTIV